jgi:hypothetical protein
MSSFRSAIANLFAFKRQQTQSQKQAFAALADDVEAGKNLPVELLAKKLDETGFTPEQLAERLSLTEQLHSLENERAECIVKSEAWKLGRIEQDRLGEEYRAFMASINARRASAAELVGPTNTGEMSLGIVNEKIRAVQHKLALFGAAEPFKPRVSNDPTMSPYEARNELMNQQRIHEHNAANARSREAAQA